MKWTMSFGLFLIFMVESSGQNNHDGRFSHPNSIQLDLGGHGLFYSLNYERIILNYPRWKTSAQVGIAYYPPATGILDVWMPVGANEMFSFGKHHVEGGLGFVWVRESGRDLNNKPVHWFWSHFASGRLGYRYQKPDGRFLFRVAFTPLLDVDANSCEFHPLGGGTIGYAF